MLIAQAIVGCGRDEYQPPKHDQLIQDARAALDAGKRQEALELYGQSLAAEATPYGYFERGKLHADMGNTDAAVADCEAGLKVAPDFPKLLWLQAELKKPPTARFKGKTANPPGGH